MSVLPTLPARPAPGPVPGPPLSLVPPLARSRAPRAPFVVLVLALLAAGLLSLLLLNTVLAQDAFRLHDLQRRTSALADQEQALARTDDALSDPTALASQARALGMTPGGAPQFLSPGAPLPKGAQVEGALVVVPGPPKSTSAPPPTTKAAPAPKAPPASKATATATPVPTTKPTTAAKPTQTSGKPTRPTPTTKPVRKPPARGSG